MTICKSLLKIMANFSEQALASKAVSLHARVKAGYHTVDADSNPVVRRVETTPGMMRPRRPLSNRASTALTR
jgi:hypothetical protein